MTRRNLQPREAVTMRASTVSQLTSLPTLGIDPRRFLETVIPLCANVAHVGKLRVAPLDEVERALRKLVELEGDAPPEERAESRQPETAGEVLANLGLRVAAGGR